MWNFHQKIEYLSFPSPQVLDPAKRGFLSKDELIKYMTEEGEPFSQEEMEELLSAAIDPESNSIHYKDYIIMMVIDEN